MLGLLPNALQLLLASLLGSQVLQPPEPPSSSAVQFHLRHEHALGVDTTTRSLSSHILFNDVPPSFAETLSPFTLHTTPTRTAKPNSLSAFSDARRLSQYAGQSSSALRWEEEEVEGPDVARRETLIELAKMTYNAYYEHGSKEWYDLGTRWNKSEPFGWEPTDDSIRGHVYVSSDESFVIITIKGTSAGWIVGGGGPTVKKDKLNDNLLFSCCCARVGPTWSTVCDCYSGSGKCDQKCVEGSLVEESLFYPVGLNLYNNVSYMYPNANIWIAGHSLGGSLSALIGATFGAPVVAFEAPAERMAARRLHLPAPPSTLHITHVFHTGDPLPMGACTGVTSTCALAGYAVESRCHQGRVIRYDTVSKLGWPVDIRSHPIQFILENLLDHDWDPENGLEVPEAVLEDEDCVDCFAWEYGDFKNATKKDGGFERVAVVEH